MENLQRHPCCETTQGVHYMFVFCVVAGNKGESLAASADDARRMTPSVTLAGFSTTGFACWCVCPDTDRLCSATVRWTATPRILLVMADYGRVCRTQPQVAHALRQGVPCLPRGGSVSRNC